MRTGPSIADNKVSIGSNSQGDAGAGITATDFGDVSLATANLVITNNDGRNSAFALIIIRDGSGGTANATGAVLREDPGVKLVNGATTNVSNRFHPHLGGMRFERGLPGD